MRTIRGCLGVMLLLTTGFAAAQDVQLRDVRLWTAPERTRVVFDLDGAFEHDLFTLDDPRRVVIDVPDAERADALAQAFEGKGFVKRIRTGVRDADDLRLVLDLEREVNPDSFTMAPKADYGHRLVVDLETGKSEKNRQPKVSRPDYANRELVVAVDAGHGGEDSGAVGSHGTLEKNVVLRIARRLASMINDEPGMRAVLTRDGDYYVGLRERIQKAREARAELFVSVHADAFRDERAEGSSVYVLSRDGASSEHARWLAEQENSADLIGGVSLSDKDEDLASFMLDLSQGASIEASLDVGGRVLDQLQQINDLHKHSVQQAGFLVLKSPDIPSLLVETAFISNPEEERELTSKSHQRKLARAMVKGIRGYFASYRPDGSPVADARKHEVTRGQTLSGIALHHGVSQSAIRRANDLESSAIQVGQTLMIPAQGQSRLAASSP